MAHAIIFTDRSPGALNFDKINWNKQFLIRPAGAYKVASQLRTNGFDAVVIPNAMNFTFAGIKHIIEQNSRDLLWVGVSSTFFTSRSSRIYEFRQKWINSDQHEIDGNPLFESCDTYHGSTELVWGDDEVNLLGDWLNEKYNAPLLIGGAWVTSIKNGNLKKLNENVFVVAGTGEQYVEDYTKQKLRNPHAVPEYVNNSNSYNIEKFKNSYIKWDKTDNIDADEWLPVEISRGCAFRCAYCDFPEKGSTDHYKNPDSLRDELIRNYEQFGVTKYIVMDDLYNEDKEKVRLLYDKVWSRLPFKPEWTSYLRLDMFWADPDSIDFVKASGCRIGSFGIETLHDRAGKKVGKGLGKKRILETLHMLKEKWGNDVLVNGLFIAGLPHEPIDSIIETMEWSKDTDLLYSYNWAPMWITPPDHKNFVLNTNRISEDNNRYGIKWISNNNWINEEGVSYEQVSKLVVDFAKQNLPLGIKVNFSNYNDFRVAGLSHEDIVAIKTDPESVFEKLKLASENLNKKIKNRIQYTLNIKDSL